jgi:hypothetical protein
VKMIGASVHGVWPQAGKGARRAVGALVQVGCFIHADSGKKESPLLPLRRSNPNYGDSLGLCSLVRYLLARAEYPLHIPTGVPSHLM